METQVIEKVKETVSATPPKSEAPNPQSRVHGRVITTKVVGVTFEGRQDVIARMQMGDRVWLEMEPDNQFDHNAIKVSRSNGEKIGYLNRFLATRVIYYFRAYGYPVKGRVTLLTGSSSDGYNLGCIIAWKLPKLTNHMNGSPELVWDDWDD